MEFMRALAWMYVGGLVVALLSGMFPNDGPGPWLRDYQDLVGSVIGAGTLLLLITQLRRDRSRHQNAVSLELRPEHKALAGAYRYCHEVLKFDFDQQAQNIRNLVHLTAYTPIKSPSEKVMRDLDEYAQSHIFALAETLSNNVATFNEVCRTTAWTWETRTERGKILLSLVRDAAILLQDAINSEMKLMDIYVSE